MRRTTEQINASLARAGWTRAEFDARLREEGVANAHPDGRISMAITVTARAYAGRR